MDSTTNWYILGPIPIPCEDPITHRSPWYFCADMQCHLCHEDPLLLNILTASLDAEEITWEQTIDIYFGQAQP